MLTVIRHPQNPLITPAHITPSHPDYEVIGVFNAGATMFNGSILLLLRVAERPIMTDKTWITCPYVDTDGNLAILRVRHDDPNYDTQDPRFIKHHHSRNIYLTSISHIRRAFSNDGVHFRIDEQPWLQSASLYEAFGVEDARITQLGDTFYINYSAVSGHGIATGLVSTRDFETFTRHGVIFPPSNRDVVIFPEKVNGMYACYHRPMPGEFGTYSIWYATSPDMVSWGNHRLVIQGDANGWDAGRVGGGAPPIWTEKGWLSIYHAADVDHRYCLGAYLTAHDDPSRVIARSRQPIFQPQQSYETEGFFPNVVFTCGIIAQNDLLRIYYGASDETIALAEVSCSTLVSHLTDEQA